MRIGAICMSVFLFSSAIQAKEYKTADEIALDDVKKGSNFSIQVTICKLEKPGYFFRNSHYKYFPGKMVLCSFVEKYAKNWAYIAFDSNEDAKAILSAAGEVGKETSVECEYDGAIVGGDYILCNFDKSWKLLKR